VRPADCLRATDTIDADHPRVRDTAASVAGDAASPADVARRLFVHVRDRFRYDPYALLTEPEHYRASALLERSRLFCVPKAIVFVALARACGIPAVLGFADVRNHLATPKVLERLRSDLFVFHGFGALHLDGRWVKASPTFNRELCAFFGVPPLEFDGRHDAMLQAFDAEGRETMEYVHDRGLRDDFPFDEMVSAWREAYPHLFDARGRFAVGLRNGDGGGGA
jgi:transglutaminase-like putative cysteine protease